MFEKIDYAFKYRAETCAELLYVLVIYPASNASPDAEMSISGEYVDEAPCFTIAGGIHETVSSGTVCGAKISEDCENTIRCSLVTCQYQDELKTNETV